MNIRKTDYEQQNIIENETDKALKIMQREFNLSRDNLGVRRYTEGDIARIMMQYLKIRYDIEISELV